MWKALALLGFVVWQWLAHLAAREETVGPLRLVLLMLPLVALAWWGIARARNKAWCYLLLIAAVALIYALARGDQEYAAAAYGVPHAAINLFLLGFFARTLRPGREALITRLARRVHGDLPPRMVTYTRRLTLAWCIFFAAQVAVSVLLFAFASVEAWSLFINVLNLPLVALMFVGEYCYKVVRYRDYPHASIATAWQAFVSDSSISPAPKVSATEACSRIATGGPLESTNSSSTWRSSPPCCLSAATSSICASTATGLRLVSLPPSCAGR